MTDYKRFYIDKSNVIPNAFVIFDDEGEYAFTPQMYKKSLISTCKALNELSDENEQLKLDLKVANDGADLYKDINEALEKENEQLKETNQELYDKLQVTMSYKSLKMGEVSILKRENEELKSDLLFKEDLIQQLKIALNTDDREEFLKYRKMYSDVCEDLADMNKDYKKLSEENEQLKQALREQLEENGNAYCIKILDKIFDLKYDEWQRKMNETHTYDYIDWEKVLKDKGDVE